MGIVLPHIQRLKPYASGAQPPEGSQVIKLNQNENPYPPSAKVLQALRTIGENPLRLYPDSRCGELRAELAKLYGVDKSQTFCGNGSSEIISLLFTVFLEPRSRIAIPDPTFSLYPYIASIHQVECVEIPTREDFSVDIDQLLHSGAQAIMLVNPNAPSGLMLPLSEVERLVSRFAGLVVIDEAYIDFAESELSAISLLDRCKNLIVVRTFSKVYSLCGARVGWCFSNKSLIAALEKGKSLYNVNAISQKLALAALHDQEYMKKAAAAVRRTRDAFSADLQKLGFGVIPSQTNFILCSPPAHLGDNGARYLYEELMERNIYVRHFEDTRLHDKLRISIGTPEEMDVVLQELHSLLGE
ncbi:histidinol-phosphate transaminase [Paenibacillus tarimensis]